MVFVFVELRAPEPIIPMHLFRIPTFTIGNSFNFMVGVAMFGAIVFLPLYLQAAKGMSPTESGLGMLPMVFGLLHNVALLRADISPAPASTVSSRFSVRRS